MFSQISAALLRTTKLCHSVEVIFRSSFCWYKLHLWLIGISQYSFHHQSNAFYFIPRCPISITLFNVPFMILDVDLTQRYIFYTLLLFLFNKDHDREWKCFQTSLLIPFSTAPLTLTFQNLINAGVIIYGWYFSHCMPLHWELVARKVIRFNLFGNEIKLFFFSSFYQNSYKFCQIPLAVLFWIKVFSFSSETPNN
jgi:hypothetical protein